MANAWLAHVKATMKQHKGMKFKEVLKMAKKTYKKTPKSAATPTASKSKKRRRSRKRKSKSKKKSKRKSKSKGRKTKKRRRRRKKKGGGEHVADNAESV